MVVLVMAVCGMVVLVMADFTVVEWWYWLWLFVLLWNGGTGYG